MNLTIAASVAAAVTLVSASPAFALSVSQTDVVVDSLANVYGTAAGGGAGVAPYQFALPGWTERVLTMDFVRGEVSCAFGVGPAGPDGGTCANNQTAINPAGNTSGIAAPRTMFLVGVFRGASASTAPMGLDYRGASPTLSDPTYAPAINQVFFIGDGLTGTGSGSQQRFVIPDAATTVELGFADAFAFFGNPGWYDDNSGSLKVDFTVTGVPEPSTTALAGVGLAALAAALRRRRATA